MRPDRFRAYDPVGNPIELDAVPASGPVSFETEAFVERVVFYAVAGDAEVVTGEVTVRRSGEIAIDVPASGD